MPSTADKDRLASSRAVRIAPGYELVMNVKLTQLGEPKSPFDVDEHVLREKDVFHHIVPD